MSARTGSKPAFLITIDTEGDNLWSRPRRVETRNSAYLPRFQALCERYGLKPTYLTNWEMAHCPVYRDFARDALRRGAAEIGMHLHAWDSPPLSPLTDDDARHHPFLIEFSTPVMREKIRAMTAALEETFAVKMVSHRAGRWAFNAVYAGLLVEQGYEVDCSVTPGVSWAGHKGDPRGSGGTDYSRFPEDAYFPDESDLGRAGASPLLEVPMTILRPDAPGWIRGAQARLRPASLPARVLRRCYPEILWLRPDGRNRQAMLRVLSTAQDQGRDYVELMLHSSEFMPGGSPTFPDDSSIERLYDDLAALFESASRAFEGLTLGEYNRRYRAAARSRSDAAQR